MAEPAESSLPEVFGRYLLLRRLSRGGMGEIFLAKSGLTGFEKFCVIKKILPHLAADRDFIRRFVDEAQVCIKLAHANIAQVFEVGMVEGEYFLALEWIDGRDLRRVLALLSERQERLPADLALLVVREVASGLAYAHRKADDSGRPLDLVHCDISPPNVVISFEGEVKIIDFGIAKSATRVSESNPNVGFGKFGYMAPEQFVRGGVVDRRTDIYAATVLLYELATGERLFHFPEGADYRALARAIAHGEHPLPGDRDPALADLDPVVRRALAAEAAQRYATADELRDALSGLLAARNPTLTVDRLGGFLRQIFADEVAEERALLRQASATDLTPFEHELDDARTQTVSFALSAAMAAPTRARSGDTSRTMRVGTETGRSRRPVRRLRATVGALALSLLAVGGALAYVLVRGRARPPRAVIAPTVIAPAPIVQPMAAPGTPPAAAEPAPTRGPRVPVDKVRKERVEPAPSTDPTPGAVMAKYQQLSRSYALFQKKYGPRFDADWNDVVQLTFDKSEPALRRLDAKLDAFRKKIARASQGEEP